MKYIIPIIFLLTGNSLISQTPVEVADLTIQLGTKDEKLLYYGFEKGDKVKFKIEERDGKDIGEIEIIEYPESSKFKDLGAISANKSVSVKERGIYILRLRNNKAFKKRKVKVYIERTPENESTLDFDTDIVWDTKLDTAYTYKTKKVTTGYRTVAKQKSNRVLSSIDTTVIKILTRTERVNSKMNLTNGNTSTLTFQIPEKISEPTIFRPTEETECVSWAYSIVVGDTGDAWYKDANKKAAAKSTTNLAVSSGLLSSGYGALALLAIEGVSLFTTPPNGDNIHFQFVQNQNGVNYNVAKGNSVAASDRVLTHKGGHYSLNLTNDNIYTGLNVQVEVIAVMATKKWEKEYYTVNVQEPIKEKKSIGTPHVKEIEVPRHASNH